MLSIIIPVYNGEKYLKSLFDCLESQSNKDFEVIIVNDGSTDGTEAQLKELERSCSGITVKTFTKENNGVSAARNFGIEKATGDWISFVDVDDKIFTQYVEFIYAAIKTNPVDIIFWNLIRDKKTDSKEVFHQNMDMFVTGKEQTLMWFLYRKITPGCCSFAVRTELLSNYKIKFNEEAKYGEDLNFIWMILACSRDVGHINNILYHYIIHPGSAMSKFYERRMDAYRAAEGLTDFMRAYVPSFADLYEKYEPSRILWSTAWQAAVKLSKRDFHLFCEQYVSKSVMGNLRTYPSLKVCLTAEIYRVSPELFRLAMCAVGKSKLC